MKLFWWCLLAAIIVGPWAILAFMFMGDEE